TSAPGPVGTGSEPPADSAAGETGPPSTDDRRTLVDLRRARRHRRTTNFDPFEALYRAYLTGIVTTIAVWLLSGVVGDTRVTAAAATRVIDHGAPVVGMATG